MTHRPNRLLSQVGFWESSQWQPILSDVLAAHVGHILLPDMLPKPETTANWQHVKIQKQLTYLENTFAQQSFLVNDYLSIADFAVAAMTTYFIKTEFPFEQYPHFYRWYKTINALNAWQKTQHKLWQSQ